LTLGLLFGQFPNSGKKLDCLSGLPCGLSPWFVEVPVRGTRSGLQLDGGLGRLLGDLDDGLDVRGFVGPFDLSSSPYYVSAF
jgi:hypothetical protein